MIAHVHVHDRGREKGNVNENMTTGRVAGIAGVGSIRSGPSGPSWVLGQETMLVSERFLDVHASPP
jgi:hypothetical protein